MIKIISFANQKGGVGKTTSAINLGSILSTHAQKVLMIDFDPQANLTNAFGFSNQENNIYDVLSGKISYSEALLTVYPGRLDLLPSHVRLAGASVELINAPHREYSLKQIIKSIEQTQQYKYILIDCPPSLDLLTLNALVSSHCVFVPLQCEYFALEGLNLLLNTIKRVKVQFNASLEVRILLTMYDQRTRLSQEIAQNVHQHFKNYVFQSIIPRSIYLGEAPSNGKPIDVYKPLSSGAEAYKKLAQEVLRYG